MTSSETQLPTPRAHLTSLLNTLFDSPTHDAQASGSTKFEPANLPHSAIAAEMPSNPLKSLSTSQRALLTTLHVLFPPPMLLQALDLLDRGLVSKIIEKSENENLAENFRDTGQEKDIVMPPQANIHLPTSASSPVITTKNGPEAKRENIVFHVRSSQPSKSRFRDLSSEGNTYTVHLNAWQCSCAAFAFSAFPSIYPVPSTAPWSVGVLASEDVEWEDKVKEENDVPEGWNFGGLGREEEVPVCKHLIACLLGERWALLHKYVKKIKVGKEEMAGLGTEG